jgi:hypothetical protein
MRNIGPNKRATTLLRKWFNRLRGWFERKILHEEDWAFDLPNGTEAAFEYLRKNTDSRQGRYLFRRDPQSKARIRLQFSGDRFFLSRKYKSQDYVFILFLQFAPVGSYLFDGKFENHKNPIILRGRYRLVKPSYYFNTLLFYLIIIFFILYPVFYLFVAPSITGHESPALWVALVLIWAFSLLVSLGVCSFFPCLSG